MLKSAIGAFASIVLAVMAGSLTARLLFSYSPPTANGASAALALAAAAFYLLVSGYGYRRWLFTTANACAIGSAAYAVAVMGLVSYITGADAIGGFFEAWYFGIVVGTLLVWFIGFPVADLARKRLKDNRKKSGRSSRRRARQQSLGDSKGSND